MRVKLGVKILVPTVIVVVLSMSVAGFIAAHRASEELWTELTLASRHLCSSLNSGLAQFVGDIRSVLIMHAEMDQIQKVLTHGSSEEVSQARAIMQNIQKMSKTLQGINLLNAQGDVVASSSADATGNFKDREYFKKAMGGEVNISDPLLSRVTGKPACIIATPVRVQGQVLGVLYARVDLAEFSKVMVEPIRIGQSGYAYLVDATGKMVSHPNSDFILQFDLSGHEWGRTMMSKNTGEVSYILDGHQETAIFEREPLTGWFVAITVHKDDLDRATDAIRLTSIATTAGAVLLVCLVLFWIVRQMCVSLGSCVAFAQSVAEGQLDRELHVRGRMKLVSWVMRWRLWSASFGK